MILIVQPCGDQTGDDTTQGSHIDCFDTQCCRNVQALKSMNPDWIVHWLATKNA